jgi:hypothetical protein
MTSVLFEVEELTLGDAREHEAQGVDGLLRRRE